VHVQLLLGNRCQSRSARCLANLPVQLHALGLERLTSPVQVTQGARLVDAVGPASNDARRHENETKENERDRGSAR